MIERDRELLARAGRVNQQLGAVVVELMQHQDGGQLPAEGLREVADHLHELARDLYARVTELEAIESGRPIVVDARLDEPE
jgi:hypothetical protein